MNRKSKGEPRYVLVNFDSEIEARDDFLPWVAHPKPKPAEPPLPFTKVPGLLEAWQKSATGWTGLVAYTFPVRGGTFGNMYGSFPATQLQPSRETSGQFSTNNYATLTEQYRCKESSPILLRLETRRFMSHEREIAP